MGPHLGAHTPVSEADLCFSKKGCHSEEVVAAAFGSCPPSPVSVAGLFFTRKNHQGLDALGQVFVLCILKLQMFPDFKMLWLTTFWLDDGMKEISLQQRPCFVS